MMDERTIIYLDDAIDAAVMGADEYYKDSIVEELMNVPPAQPVRIQNNAVHLCDSCQYTYVTCPSHGNDAVFGDGKGNDNICACNKYRPISAQPEPHWIPCGDRLPENNNPVNVTWINLNPQAYYSDIKDKRFTATAHYHNGHWYWYSSVTQDLLDEYGDWDIELVDEDVEIIAWMPLPEPYNEK